MDWRSKTNKTCGELKNVLGSVVVRIVAAQSYGMVPSLELVLRWLNALSSSCHWRGCGGPTHDVGGGNGSLAKISQ